jgi:4-amino-4-deoxy-L-arabinose transferase-like glycosyltransferase
VEAITSAKHRASAAGLILLSGLLFFTGLGSIGFIGPDEPRYAEVAREMLISGDYISPRLCGCLWFEKPPLLYWMAAAAYHLFGVGEFAARFPSALSALIIVLAVFYTAGRSMSYRAGLAAAAVLATSLIFIGYARACATDMPLAAAISLALLAFHRSDSDHGRCRYWVLGAAATGAAVLAKGLVGLLLVAGIWVVFRLVTRSRIAPSWLSVTLGTIAFVTVVSSWYLPVTIHHGESFVREFFVNHHFRRYTENRFQHPQPFYFFPFVAAAGAIPWTFFLIPAAARLGKLGWRRPGAGESLVLLCWIWLIGTVLFFSFSWSKLPGYVLPVFPPLAIIIGYEIAKILEGDRSRIAFLGMALTALLLIAIGIAPPVYARQEGIVLAGIAAAVIWVPLVGSIASGAMLLAGKVKLFLIGPIISVLLLVALLLAVFVPRMEDELSSRSLSQAAAAALRPGERIAFYITKEYGPVFYAEGRVACGLRGEDVLNAYDPADIELALKTEGSLVVFARRYLKDDLLKHERIAAEPLMETERVSVMRVRLRPTN